MLLTNDGDLARALEMPNYAVERAYKVRVFGRMFKDEVITKLRKGFLMSGRQYGPYIVSPISINLPRSSSRKSRTPTPGST
jgi:16S rRNA U516 pseudouridylate synthase RsuA-like enzyme